ncbi:MAG: (2Fe-2S)-binding protein [Alphaproteobacteria bacterium]|nr:(2Fe-2S)-binding protein [Alphaproteobacteria bacterium]
MAKFTLDVNAQARTVDVPDPQEPLLYVLRNDLKLTGAKYGCGLGQCGSCTVLIDGEAVRSCMLPVSAVNGKISTIESLAANGQYNAVQQAFIEEQAAQCGYCTNGMVMTVTAFLGKNKSPSQAQMEEALANNLCRCGTHERIVNAAMKAAQSSASAK